MSPTDKIRYAADLIDQARATNNRAMLVRARAALADALVGIDSVLDPPIESLGVYARTLAHDAKKWKQR